MPQGFDRGLPRLLGAALRPAAGVLSTARRWTGEAVLSGIDAVVSSSVAERAVEHALQGPLIDRVAEDLARHAVLERVVDHLLAEGAIEHAMDRVLEGPELERLAGAIRARLLDSEEMWMLVDEIARSPAVTEAITHQGVGFADQVAGGMRARTRSADAWLERAAQRALRRAPR